MARLSVNVNKIATLRNSRGKNQPNLIKAVESFVGFGVKGITVHPRPDGRHILYKDVRQIKELLKNHPEVEFNVEGYPSSDFLKLMKEVQPEQCTLVPDAPLALTSNAGWNVHKCFDFLKPILSTLKKNKIRTSLFIDPIILTEREQNVLSNLKPERVELYTEAYASAYSTNRKDSVTRIYKEAAKKLVAQGIEINAGHDLDLNNLLWLLKNIPQIKEVSIGHALICESLYQGLKVVVQKYLKICQQN